MNSTIRFDESLPIFVDLVVREWGLEAVKNNIFLRDASGRLTFVVVDGERSGKEREKLSQKATETLQGYTDADGFAVATPEELFDESLKNINTGWLLPVETNLFSGKVRLVDRRVIGADWLRTPLPAVGGTPRIVFASVKGGVGRSTALCVLAANLMSHGLRVLAIDMDLEAPGLGNMLLTRETLPEFGLLDYLVETGLNPVEDDFYVDMIAASWLGGGKGSVSVIPALGLRSISQPVNVLAKIARAYLEQKDQAGNLLGISDRMQRLLSYLESRRDYDVILIDARAGLHETTASAIIGLGAEVLLFGTDQPQTFSGYEMLFSHLSTLQGRDWYKRLHFVQAKAPIDHERRSDFSDKMQSLMITYLWKSSDVEVKIRPDVLKGTFDIEWSDDISDEDLRDLIPEEGEDSPNSVVSVIESADFREFDPVKKPDILTNAYYNLAFGEFLGRVLNFFDSPPQFLSE